MLQQSVDTVMMREILGPDFLFPFRPTTGPLTAL